MPRDLPIGNGTLLINFDRDYQLRDIYYPRVGQENHTGGEACRVGVWVDGTFCWLNDPSWSRRQAYMTDTLVTQAELAHPELQLQLLFNDTVDVGRDLLVRRIAIRNTGATREVRLFFHFDWHLYGTDVGDTAMFYPPIKGLVAYKGHRYFAAVGQVGERVGVDAYACGKKEVGGAQGTWRDAEDGELGGNPIEQGSVDMTLGLHAGQVPAGEVRTVYQWLIAAKDLQTVQTLAQIVVQRTPEAFIERTRNYWIAWVSKNPNEFADLSPNVAELYRRSLLILRTQVDNGGAIIAANDSEIIKFARDTYSYMWPRDGAMVAYAMDQAGYMEVPRQFFTFCAGLITEEGYFRHKYTPAGEPGSSWHPWVDKAGHPQYPIQEDETGLVLFSLWHHYQTHRDFEFYKPHYRPFIIRAADFLARYLEPSTGLPDASHDLWEERRGIMSYTVAAVWAGLQAAANFAELYGETNLKEKYRTVAASIKQSALEHLFDPELNRFLRRITVRDGTIVKDVVIDSSLYGLFYFGMFEPDDPRVVSTMRAVYERLWCKTPVGGIARYEDDHYYQVTQDIRNAPGNPWFICTMWYAQWLVAFAKSQSDLSQARDILEWVADAALPSGVLSEQLHPYTKSPLSVSPLTWSHATAISLIHEYLEKRRELSAWRGPSAKDLLSA